jgi:structural maintenance of chromosome 2
VTDPAEAGRRIQKLEETKEKLKKNVNTRAMNMFSKAEEQYNDLMKRKKIVEDDKAKINETIKELDIKKKEALRKAWDQVDREPVLSECSVRRPPPLFILFAPSCIGASD